MSAAGSPVGDAKVGGAGTTAIASAEPPLATDDVIRAATRSWTVDRLAKEVSDSFAYGLFGHALRLLSCGPVSRAEMKDFRISLAPVVRYRSPEAPPPLCFRWCV